MKPTVVPFLAAALLAGCASNSIDKSSRSSDRDKGSSSRTASGQNSSALTLSGYKRDAAQHISSTNYSKVYSGRPQALLRSVVVMKYTIDSQGRVMRSEILRSNHDGETESIATHALRAASPLPRPSSRLLRNGQLEVIETWLFNDDGRFQLRTIALPQMDS